MKTEEERIYYVTMTDSFMSGWGEANGRINKLVFVCQGYEEAQIVEDNAQNRTEMKYINICANKPYYNKRDYLTQYKTKADYGYWYVKNYFRDGLRLE
jgi:hypothetical protein